MELQVIQDAFVRALQLVQSVVEPRQTLPILANVLLEASGEILRISATDLEVAVNTSIPAVVTVPGGITLNARKLHEIVRELPAEVLRLQVQENSWVSLKCGRAEYKVVGLPKEDFPAGPQVKGEGGVRLPAARLKEVISRTSFAISHDEGRYALNGIHVTLREKGIQLVATDGHRLAMASCSVEGEKQAAGIVPRKAVQELLRALSGDEPVEVDLQENQFMVRMSTFELVSRLIEGQFPNYEQVIPRNQPIRVLVGRDALVAALRRVSVVADDRTKPVKLSLSPGQLKVAAHNPDFGEAEETLDIDYSGPEMTMGFNSRYLLDALGPIERGTAVVELKDSLSPGVVKSLEDGGDLCVIMPMRI